MSLSVRIGILSESFDDPDWENEVRGDFAIINRVLLQAGLPEHSEPEEWPNIQNQCRLGDFRYSAIHSLRRIFAHAVAGIVPTPLLENSSNPAGDPVLLQVASQKHHLLWHSDAEGFYVPVDFQEVLEDDDLPGRFLGSSQRLLDELRRVAPALGIAMKGTILPKSEAERLNQIFDQEPSHPFEEEIAVWFYLYENARLSVRHSLIIKFC